MTTPGKKKPSRLVGLELFRGIAVFFVILVHVDDANSLTSNTWSYILKISGFAVPFFLATSFYFLIQKAKKCDASFYRKRIARLLVPYFVWSLIYIGYKLSKSLASNDFESISNLLKDQFSLWVTGNAAFHLYFIPLLLSGILLTVAFSELIVKTRRKSLVLIAVILSIATYQIVLQTNNAFDMASATAFNELTATWNSGVSRNFFIRFPLVLAAFMIRCLPYITIALLIHKWERFKLFVNSNSKIWILFILLFFAVNFMDLRFLPESICEVSKGYLFMLLGISISAKLKSNFWIESLGASSFGIYLVHLLFLDMFFILDNRLKLSLTLDINFFLFLIISLLTLLLSWVTVVFLSRTDKAARLLFGT